MKNMEIRLAERLFALRGDDSQAEFSQKIGILQSAYNRYERGAVIPGGDMIYQICKQLNVSADWLLGLTDDRGNPAPIRQESPSPSSTEVAVLHERIRCLEAEITRLHETIREIEK